MYVHCGSVGGTKNFGEFGKEMYCISAIKKIVYGKVFLLARITNMARYEMFQFSWGEICRNNRDNVRMR